MSPYLILLLAYLIGGIPFGYLIVKLTTGQDVRGSGSGNIGATNVLRTTGRAAGVVTLLLDILKGFAAVWLMARFTGDDPLWTSLAALSVMAGHAFPIFLAFKGGKAVASFIGAFLYLAPLPLLAVLVLFVIVVAVSRYISLGSIIAAGTFPLGVWLIQHPPAPVWLAALIAGAFIVYRHRANIERIRNGNENVFSFGGKKGAAMTKLAIIGGGSWGTALAIALAPRFDDVRLWFHERDIAERAAATRENDVFLPGFRLPANILPGSDLGEALSGADVVLGVMPSHHARGLYERMLEHLEPSMRFVSATKGIENGTLLRMTEIVAEVVGRKFIPRVAALSGPTFAREVARGDPAAVVISSRDAELAGEIQSRFAGPSLRLYTNDDPVGVELGAALKNVIAIAAGVCAGLSLGSNSMAALITRGLAEITRLAVARGGKPRTLAGLAGLGDLVLTCTGDLSRNRQVGMELGKGRKLSEIMSSMRMVAEGVHTTHAAYDLARRESIEMPITEQMYGVLELGKSPRETIRELMERRLKAE